MTLKERRLDKGWSQEQLAAISGISARTIQRAEMGKPIGLESQKALAAAFEIAVGDLVVRPQGPASTGGDPKSGSTAEEPNGRQVFFMHVATFVAVMPALCVMNFIFTPLVFWCFIVGGFWFAALMLHFFIAFDVRPARKNQPPQSG